MRSTANSATEADPNPAVQAFAISPPSQRTKFMTRKAVHLLGFVQHGVISHATGMWRHPSDKINWDWSRPPYWQHLARTMERGLFDAMFIADELAPYNNYKGSSDDTVRYAVQCPVHEPSTIVPIIAAATTH